jgi:hypothetical protein
MLLYFRCINSGDRVDRLLMVVAVALTPGVRYFEWRAIKAGAHAPRVVVPGRNPRYPAVQQGHPL